MYGASGINQTIDVENVASDRHLRPQTQFSRLLTRAQAEARGLPNFRSALTLPTLARPPHATAPNSELCFPRVTDYLLTMAWSFLLFCDISLHVCCICC